MSTALSEAPARPIDTGTFWRTAGLRATGAAVVTAQAKDGPRGFFALSATHLSASPPLMMVSVDEKTSALETIVETGHFAINYLSKAQDEQMTVFSGKAGLQGPDRFGAAQWTALSTGAPALVDAAGVVDCTVREVIRRHGAAIVIGEVVDFQAGTASPLICYKGKTL